MGEHICQYTSDKRLNSKIYKEVYNLTSRTQTTPLFFDLFFFFLLQESSSLTTLFKIVTSPPILPLPTASLSNLFFTVSFNVCNRLRYHKYLFVHLLYTLPPPREQELTKRQDSCLLFCTLFLSVKARCQAHFTPATYLFNTYLPIHTLILHLSTYQFTCILIE